jgi:hypothetical protein
LIRACPQEAGFIAHIQRKQTHRAVCSPRSLIDTAGSGDRIAYAGRLAMERISRRRLQLFSGPIDPTKPAENGLLTFAKDIDKGIDDLIRAWREWFCNRITV